MKKIILILGSLVLIVGLALTYYVNRPTYNLNDIITGNFYENEEVASIQYYEGQILNPSYETEDEADINSLLGRFDEIELQRNNQNPSGAYEIRINTNYSTFRIEFDESNNLHYSSRSDIEETGDYTISGDDAALIREEIESFSN